MILLGVVAFVIFMLAVTVLKQSVPLDHVNFLSGTLGQGKTSFAVFIARRLSRRKKLPIVANFQMVGAAPLDTSTGRWPVHPCVIILDEILLLESNNMLPYDWLALGLTCARQFSQTVIILCQTHRPPFPKKFWGTIGQWMVITGMSFGNLGRIVVLQRSMDPFVRVKGFRGNRPNRHLVWLPRWVFSAYTKPIRIYGFEKLEEILRARNQGAGAGEGLPLSEREADAPVPKVTARQRKRAKVFGSYTTFGKRNPS